MAGFWSQTLFHPITHHALPPGLAFSFLTCLSRSCLRKASDISVLVTSRVRSVVLQGEFLGSTHSFPHLFPLPTWLGGRPTSLPCSLPGLHSPLLVLGTLTSSNSSLSTTSAFLLQRVVQNSSVLCPLFPSFHQWMGIGVGVGKDNVEVGFRFMILPPICKAGYCYPWEGENLIFSLKCKKQKQKTIPWNQSTKMSVKRCRRTARQQREQNVSWRNLEDK